MGPLTALIIAANIRQPGLTIALENAGFQVIEASDSGEGVRHVLEQTPSIVVIGEDMPPLAGVELLPLLRSLTDSPIITLGAGGETPMVDALLNGADVYLAIPVNLRELMARIRALLRRYGAAKPCGEPYSPS